MTVVIRRIDSFTDFLKFLIVFLHLDYAYRFSWIFSLLTPSTGSNTAFLSHKTHFPVTRFDAVVNLKWWNKKVFIRSNTISWMYFSVITKPLAIFCKFYDFAGKINFATFSFDNYIFFYLWRTSLKVIRCSAQRISHLFAWRFFAAYQCLNISVCIVFLSIYNWSWFQDVFHIYIITFSWLRKPCKQQDG